MTTARQGRIETFLDLCLKVAETTLDVMSKSEGSEKHIRFRKAAQIVESAEHPTKEQLQELKRAFLALIDEAIEIP